jgi:site-specific DNA-methyltransferase (adenine-specific)
MPKRPPRMYKAPTVPADLRAAHQARISKRSKAENFLAHRDKRGEIWLADAVHLLAALPSGSVDLVVTDPPYNISKADWDTFASLDVYTAWCDQWMAEIARVLAPHGSAYVCGFSEILAEVKAKSARRFAGCKWLIWYYRNKANLGSDWGRSHESILHLRMSKGGINVDDVRIPYNGHTTKYPDRIQAVSSQYSRPGEKRDTWQPHPLGAKPRDVLEVAVLANGTTERLEHPTQKPEALIEKLILASSKKGQLVVDPFSGSGTTAAVAARLGRRYIVADNAPEYVAMTRTRVIGD